MNTIGEMVRGIQRKNVSLWVDEGQLRYRAPKGALTAEDLSSLKRCRDQIVDFLATATGEEIPQTDLTAGVREAPLTFSQWMHWRLFQLDERPAIRQIASATRLSGDLDLAALRAALAEVVRRHSALRTRIEIRDGVPWQRLHQSDCELVVHEVREEAVTAHIDEMVMEPIDVRTGPLAGVRLLRLGDREHVLIIVLEHLISDMVSLNIFLRELFSAYFQAAQHAPFSWTHTPVQFIDFAAWQQRNHAAWIEKHGAYWTEKLRGCGRLRWPDGGRGSGTRQVGWSCAPVRIGRDTKLKLRDRCRQARTTLALCVFALYAFLVLRWCDVKDGVFQFVVDGRMAPELQSSIGYYASRLLLRVRLQEGDSFLDLIRRTASEYSNAYEHADSSFHTCGSPNEGVALNCAFNWIPAGKGLDVSDVRGPESGLTCTPVPFEHPMPRNVDKDAEPALLLFESEDEIAGDLYYPPRLAAEGMETFVQKFHSLVQAFVEDPQTPIAEIRAIS